MKSVKFPSNKTYQLKFLYIYLPNRSIMASVNGSLIKKVFDAILIHKPSLAKYLVTDQDEEEIDPCLKSNVMQKILLALYFSLPICLVLMGHKSFAQCSGGTHNGSLNMTEDFQTISFSHGTYKTFTAIEGNQYSFTFCGNGGSTSFDTELTILDNTGVFAGGYNDDSACGLPSELTWTAPSSNTDSS